MRLLNYRSWGDSVSGYSIIPTKVDNNTNFYKYHLLYMFMGFTHILGENNAVAKVLDFMTSSAVDVDYNVADIAEDAELSWEYAKDVISRLVKAGIVVKTRSVGRSDMYKLADNKVAKELLKFIDALDLQLAKQKSKEVQIA